MLRCATRRCALTNYLPQAQLYASAVERSSREGKQDMATTTIASAAARALGPPLTSSERWTSYSALVLAICILGWAFDIYEATIMQLVTPILIKEWGITPATMGTVTTLSRWIGLIGTFLFPVLADLYGRRPALIWSILVYAVFTGFTGFSTGWVTLSDLELDHPHRACRRKSGRHADGDRDGADQMARHRARRPRRRLSARLHAVLARRAGRGAAVGLALALFPRHFAGAAGAVDPHRHQGKPALRARHRGDAQGGPEEAARHLRAGRENTRAKC